jgi:DNA-binding response OmpR family regulator
VSGYRILVVDDDYKTVELIRLYLEREGHHVLTAYDGRDALELIRQKKPGLVILDLMLPTINGLDICRILSLESRTPMIMLTAKSTEDDILLGLDLGADDYITKPFSPRQLMARVRAVLRRTGELEEQSKQSIIFGELELDPLCHEVRCHDTLIELTPREFKLLETLMLEPGRAFSRLELVERVFGFDYKGLERTVDAHIMNLRKKLSPDDSFNYIQTVYGVGYKFAAQIPQYSGPSNR